MLGSHLSPLYRPPGRERSGTQSAPHSKSSAKPRQQKMHGRDQVNDSRGMLTGCGESPVLHCRSSLQCLTLSGFLLLNSPPSGVSAEDQQSSLLKTFPDTQLFLPSIHAQQNCKLLPGCAFNCSGCSGLLPNADFLPSEHRL